MSFSRPLPVMELEKVLHEMQRRSGVDEAPKAPLAGLSAQRLLR
jgi:hypothetical protein